MKILRSEAVDKSLGVFFDAEFDFNGPGTPGAIKSAKKPIRKFQKIAKNYKNDKNIDLGGQGPPTRFGAHGPPASNASPGVDCSDPSGS